LGRTSARATENVRPGFCVSIVSSICDAAWRRHGGMAETERHHLGSVMARKRYKPEEIVAKLRQVDVLVSQGQNIVDAIRQMAETERHHLGSLGDRPPTQRSN
jgi:flagellar biosynthesis regulator FlbT